MRKFLSLALILMLAFSLSPVKAEANEPVTLSMFSVKAPLHGPWEEMIFFDEMEKLTGVSWTFDLVERDSLAERKALLLGSGQLPDVMAGVGFTDAELLDYGSMGAFLPLEDYINEQTMPNLTAFLEENPEYKAMMTSSDGHIYSLIYVSAVPRDVAGYKTWVNNEWLKALNLEIPATLDEFHDMLAAFKTQDPNGNGQADEIPISFSSQSNGIAMFRAAILAANGIAGNNYNSDLYLDADDNVQYVYTSEAYKAYLEFAHTLYSEGLLDNECFSQTDSQLTAKGNQSLVGCFMNLASYIVDTTEHYPIYESIPPMTSEMNDEQITWQNWLGNTGTFVLSSTCANPEAALKWADYLYSPEGGILLSQGPEGYGWDYVDDTRTYWDKNVPEGFGSSEEYRGTLTPDCGTFLCGYINPDFLLHLNAPHVINLEEHVAKSYTPYLKPGYPRVKLSDEAQEISTTYYTDINKYVTSCEARFISGDMDLAQWDEYLANLESMHLQDYLKVYQDAYVEYQALNG